MQGIQDDWAKKISEEFEAAVTLDVKGKIDWVHSKENQEPWPRKTMVSLLFWHGIERGLREREESNDRRRSQSNGEMVRVTLDLSSQRKPLGKAQAVFCKALSEASGDKSEIWPVWGKIEVSFFCSHPSG